MTDTPLVFHNADQEIVSYDGSPLNWRVSAYGLVVQNDSVLIIKNRKEKLWDIPGGGIEMGESIEAALAREGMEEAGVALKPSELIYHCLDWFYHAGQKKFYQTLRLVYKAEIQGELEKPSDPNIEIAKFVTKAELKTYHFPAEIEKAIELLSLK